MSHLPFAWNLEPPHPFYNHNMFPNSVYRREHERVHHPMDLHTLGLITRLAPHLRHLVGGPKPRDGLSPIVGKEYGVNITSKDGEFSVHLDVALFLPEELTVKVVNDFLVIEAKHEERESDDSGYVARHLMRRYPLPKGYDPDSIHSTLTSDGVLSVIMSATKDEPKELIIPIQQVAPTELVVKEKFLNGDNEKKGNPE